VGYQPTDEANARVKLPEGFEKPMAFSPRQFIKFMLKFIALSGTTGVTENLYVYETEDDLLVVDCGVGFPDLEMPGVDLVLPDFSYIVKNKNKLRGVLVSQGHEDHTGALPFLLKEVKTEIWASPLVTEFIKDKFKDYRVSGYQINTFNSTADQFNIGPFNVQPFSVTHSIPDTVGFAIDTPEGRIFHIAEHRIDQHPVVGRPFDRERLVKLAEKEALFLASDCLGANKPGFIEGELAIEGNILDIVKDAKQAVFTTAISSNIGRFQQIINVAAKTGRKVIFVGRSVQKKAEIAHRLGFLEFSDREIISYSQSEKYSPRELLYIVSGCYGQVGSSLYRISLEDHDQVKIAAGDTMIFSADPAPDYSKETEDFVIDNLINLGVDVHYYDLHEGLYISGHGGQEDIKALFEIVKPKYFIPVGGTARFMQSYGKLVQATGADISRVFKLKAGESVVFTGGRAQRGETVHTRDVLVHGLGIGDIGKVVLSDRAALGTEGIAIPIIRVNKAGHLVGKCEITSRGFVYQGENYEFLEVAAGKLASAIKVKNVQKQKAIKETAINFLEKYFFEKTGRRPMILPVVVEI
jgi:ribonuclease J